MGSDVVFGRRGGRKVYEDRSTNEGQAQSTPVRSGSTVDSARSADVLSCFSWLVDPLLVS